MEALKQDGPCTCLPCAYMCMHTSVRADVRQWVWPWLSSQQHGALTSNTASPSEADTQGSCLGWLAADTKDTTRGGLPAQGRACRQQRVSNLSRVAYPVAALALRSAVQAAPPQSPGVASANQPCGLRPASKRTAAATRARTRAELQLLCPPVLHLDVPQHLHMRAARQQLPPGQRLSRAAVAAAAARASVLEVQRPAAGGQEGERVVLHLRLVCVAAITWQRGRMRERPSVADLCKQLIAQAAAPPPCLYRLSSPAHCSSLCCSASPQACLCRRSTAQRAAAPHTPLCSAPAPTPLLTARLQFSQLQVCLGEQLIVQAAALPHLQRHKAVAAGHKLCIKQELLCRQGGFRRRGTEGPRSQMQHERHACSHAPAAAWWCHAGQIVGLCGPAHALHERTGPNAWLNAWLESVERPAWPHLIPLRL